MTIRIDVVHAGRDQLGEGPVWDARESCLYWVDQLVPCVRRLVPATGGMTTWTTPSTVGCLALAEQPGELVLALEDGFHRMRLHSGACEPIARVDHGGAGIRMNDGRCDRQGRFVAGSLVTGRADPDGAIHRLDAQGRVERLRHGLIVTNGICFNALGSRMYYTDSRTGVMMTSAYGADTHAIDAPRPFADTRTLLGSVPDGATVDADGGVWIALIENGKVARFHPDGTLDRAIQLPAPYVTSACFGGPELDVLYVTSVSDTGMRLRTDHPLGGALFAVHGLGVRGVPEPRFGGAAQG